MTWQAAHSWKKESAKSGVMLFDTVPAYGLNEAGGHGDRETAQIRLIPRKSSEVFDLGQRRMKKVSAEANCCNPSIVLSSTNSLQSCYLIT